MISDQDDHIRRNIVLVSSGILLAAWLELPGASLLTSVLPDSTLIAPYKLWAVGFAVLAYLGVRYQFSEDGKEFQTKLRKQVIDYRAELMENSLKQPARRRYSFEEACELIPGEQLPALELIARKHISIHRMVKPAMPAVRVEDFYFKTNRSLSTNVNFEFESEAKQEVIPVGANTRPEISWRQPYVFFAFSLPACFKGWGYSPAGIQYLAPIALAVIAETVLMSRLVVSYWIA